MANGNKKRAAATEKTAEEDFSGLVESLCSPKNGAAAGMRKRWQEQALPSRLVIGEIVEALRSILFPGYFGFSELKAESLRFHVGSTLDPPPARSSGTDQTRALLLLRGGAGVPALLRQEGPRVDRRVSPEAAGGAETARAGRVRPPMREIRRPRIRTR